MNVELGIFVERDGLPAVRLERPFAVGVEEVWQALTEPSRLAVWFLSPTVHLEPMVGGRVDFAHDRHAVLRRHQRLSAWNRTRISRQPSDRPAWPPSFLLPPARHQ